MPTVYDVAESGRAPILEARDVSVLYGREPVVRGVSLPIPAHHVVTLVGPSGCGKSTFLRCLNRMNDLHAEARVSGQVLFHGRDVYDSGMDAAEVRRRIGMVFQKPTPFPGSIFQNVAFGPRVHGYEGDLSGLVEDVLRQAALWSEVSDRLHEPAARLSAGQQQRLCIARALAVGPEVLLMDEPALGLDPGASQRIEELVYGLSRHGYTIVVVTHNMQQAARISDFTAFLNRGELVEYGPTDAIFTNPREEATEAYVTGRFG